MSISQILAILRARWVVMVSVLFGTILIAVAVNVLLPKKYTSTASLLLDVKSPDPVNGMISPAMMTPSYMATQVDLLTSERVAIQVIRRLRLAENPTMQKQWREASSGVGSIESWLAEILSKSLTVKPSRESNVITVSYEAIDPQFAAALANAYAEGYIDVTVSLKTDPARQYNSIFDGLATRMRERLEKAQARLSAYQQEKGLIATDERFDIESARLASLSQELTLLEGLQNDSGNRQIQANRDSDRVSEVLNNQVVAALKADLARMESKAEELQSRFGDAHPQVIETKANIDAMRKRVSQETQRVTTSVGLNNVVNQARVAKATSSLQEQRSKVLQMRAQRDEASVMLRDVDNLQKAYDAVQARATQSGMESQTTQTNVSVIQVASASSKSSSPKTLINMLLGVFGGLILSITTVLLRELSDRRVRTIDDVVNELNLPLIGVLLKSSDSPSGLLGRKAQPWLMQQPSSRTMPALASE